MAPKHQLEKTAWQWAETTDPDHITIDHIRTAFRTGLRQCKENTCRKNCSGNPCCVRGLGAQWWLSELDDSQWSDITDDESRKQGSFIGLKNLGATCYVNTFLQVWFHNVEFRNAILGWHAIGEYTHQDTVESSPMQPPMPTTICGHLQFIFAQLMFSNRTYVDPSPLIKCLQLNASLQQDAQEFSKLFMSLLEDQLSRHPDSLYNQVQRQFQGTYVYTTRCSSCGNSSNKSSSFYELELNIKGHKDIKESIGEFLKEESLNGDNQYMCGWCMRKQDATRSIHLHSLPPVLNLQLMRFVFDRNSGRKKKLNTCLQFPQTLDMSSYLNKPAGSWQYELRAVLVHSGPSAHSGHYVAHIWDTKTRAWYKFNDESVEKMSGRDLQLSNEDELDGKSTTKAPRNVKGVHASRNAYMLVYFHSQPHMSDEARKQTSTAEQPGPSNKPSQAAPINGTDQHCTTTQPSEVRMQLTDQPGEVQIKLSDQPSEVQMKLSDLSSEVQACVEHDNAQFSEWLKDLRLMKENNISKGKSRQSDIREIYQLLTAPGEGSEWIKTSWISKWLATDHREEVMPVDNAGLLCSHNRLDPDRVQQAKFINRNAADLIYAKYGGGPRLAGDEVLCAQCVYARCRHIRYKVRLTEDSKLITAVLKNSTSSQLDGEEMFFVGKKSLRNWRRLAASTEHCIKVAANGEQLVTHKPEINCEQSENGDQLVTHKPEVDHELPENGDQLVTHKHEVNEERSENGEQLVTHKPEVDHSHPGTSDLSVNHKPKEKPSNHEPPENTPPSNREQPVNSERSDNIKQSVNQQPTPEEDPEDELIFNHDLLCPHDGLSTDEGCRRAVPAHVWRRLLSYFPQAPQFTVSSPVCPICKSEDDAEEVEREQWRSLAQDQRRRLPDLYLSRNRPSLTSPGIVHVISDSFLSAWRQFIKDPLRTPPPASTENASLLCGHSKFLFDPATNDPSSTRYHYVTSAEWLAITEHIPADCEIKITAQESEVGAISHTVSPEVCSECCSARQMLEYQSQFSYERATVYIRKMNADEKKSQNERSSAECDGKRVSQSGDDADYIQLGGKRKTPEAGDSGQKMARLDRGAVRRSSRHHRSHGEKKLVVDSSHTLLQLKLQIMELFAVAPYDQHLEYNGAELCGDKTSLCHLQIQPGSTIYLKADEPSGDVICFDEVPAGTSMEEGFKGTGLLSS